MKWIFWIFVFLYVAALALLAIGTTGAFGQERDPLSGVFLLPLGLPWNLLLDRTGVEGAAAMALAPLANAIILFLIWKRPSISRR